MKKISKFLISILSILLFQSLASASTDTSCYIEFAQLNIDNNTLSSLLLETSNQDIYVTQNNVALPLISYEKLNRYIPFSSNISQKELSGNTDFKNKYTFGDIDTSENKTIELSFDTLLEAQSYEVLFSHDARYHRAEFYVSEDGESYSQVLPGDIGDFSIIKMKIIFEKTGPKDIREIIHINNLSINKNLYTTQVLDVNNNLPLIIYRNNSCSTSQKKLSEALSSQINQLSYQPDFYPHPKYLEKTNDSDSDGIKDLYDNCKYYNPQQRDINNNSIGDTCDQKIEFLQNNDKDSDGIVDFNDNCKAISNPDQADDDNDRIGNVCDNCRNIQNTKQLDFNFNGIGDICEDSDGDGISGLTDNCINIANSDQADDDNDGIGNLCEDDDRDNIIFSLDNCPHTSNRNQLDTDNDGLGDRCDDSDDRLLESNKEIFIGLMFLIFTLFGVGIYTMFRKLQK